MRPGITVPGIQLCLTFLHVTFWPEEACAWTNDDTANVVAGIHDERLTTGEGVACVDVSSVHKLTDARMHTKAAKEAIVCARICRRCPSFRTLARPAHGTHTRVTWSVTLAIAHSIIESDHDQRWRADHSACSG